MRIYVFSEDTKRLARIALKEAIQRRKIKPPKCCQVCGRDKWLLLKEKADTTDRFAPKASDKNRPIVAHHYNYLSPFNVWWLCNACHTDLHKFQRKYKCVVISLKGIKQIFAQSSKDKRRNEKKTDEADLRKLKWEQAQLTIDEL